jgi:nitroimidazol reductase NimA-like FMN-containing flavoprotein (pyridoxamine 5'-phosphate oxidase superfamily)
MDLTMTAAERLAFISDTPRVGVLSLDAPDRAPVSSPIWYTVEADGSITFSVGEESRKAALLRANGRATLAVQSEVAPYQYVTIEGATTELGAATEASRLDRAIRYLGPEFGAMYHEANIGEAEVTFALEPQRWSSLDYNKLFV